MSSIAEQLRSLLAGREDLAAVYLFGSVAEGTAHALSDLDVAVLFRAGLSDTAVFERSLEIGALLEDGLQRRVDLVALNRASLCFASRCSSTVAWLPSRARMNAVCL